jgi:hypothetical protein
MTYLRPVILLYVVVLSHVRAQNRFPLLLDTLSPDGRAQQRRKARKLPVQAAIVKAKAMASCSRRLRRPKYPTEKARRQE